MRDLTVSERLMQLHALTEQKEKDFLYFLDSQGFKQIRRLENGEYVGIMELITTTSVCCDITENRTFSYRWCFKDFKEAELFLNTMIDYDEVPISRKSLVGHRYIDTPRLEEQDERGFNKW